MTESNHAAATSGSPFDWRNLLPPPAVQRLHLAVLGVIVELHRPQIEAGVDEIAGEIRRALNSPIGRPSRASSATCAQARWREIRRWPRGSR